MMKHVMNLRQNLCDRIDVYVPWYIFGIAYQTWNGSKDHQENDCFMGITLTLEKSSWTWVTRKIDQNWVFRRSFQVGNGVAPEKASQMSRKNVTNRTPVRFRCCSLQHGSWLALESLMASWLAQVPEVAKHCIPEFLGRYLLSMLSI